MTSPSSKEATTRTINVRLPVSVYERLEGLAKATSRTKSFVTLEALSSYLNEQSWQISDIEAAISEADNGDFASPEQVKNVMAKYGA
jgi:RHH-type transcriptional regulator, rel operon repressor / antitoxin RelB